jgi:hypothetical protein
MASVLALIIVYTLLCAGCLSELIFHNDTVIGTTSSTSQAHRREDLAREVGPVEIVRCSILPNTRLKWRLRGIIFRRLGSTNEQISASRNFINVMVRFILSLMKGTNY